MGLPINPLPGDPGSQEAISIAQAAIMRDLEARKAARAAVETPNYNQFSLTGFGPDGVTHYDTTDPTYTGPSPSTVGGGFVAGPVLTNTNTVDLLRANSNLGVGGSMTPQKFTQTQMGSEFGAMQTPQATYKSDLIKSLRTADAPTVSNAGFTQYSMSAPQGGSNYLPTGSSNSNAAFNPQPLLPNVASAEDVANWNAYSTYRTNALTAKTPYVSFDEWLAGGKVSGTPEPVTTPETVYNYGANDGGGA